LKHTTKYTAHEIAYACALREEGDFHHEVRNRANADGFVIDRVRRSRLCADGVCEVYKAGFWEKVRRGSNWQPFYDLYGLGYGLGATRNGIGVIEIWAELESESLFQPNLFSPPRHRP
jgi:hypothetical protein